MDPTGERTGHRARRPAAGARTLREALRRGGGALPEALWEADDGALLAALDERLPADRAARVVVELVRRAPERRPEAADAVCERVLTAGLYLDAVSGPWPADGGPPGDGGGRLRVRNAVLLYEGLVRPYAARGAAPELLARVLPRLWAARDGAGREAVRRIVGGGPPTGFGERGWKALFTGADHAAWTAGADHDHAGGPSASDRASESDHAAGADPVAGVVRVPYRPAVPPGAVPRHGGPDRPAPRRSPGGPRGDDGGWIDLQPGQLWVAALLTVIAVALVLIVVLATR
ncbi:hypothetical protein RKE29_02535 [Streptomyces sp. B1866]|uniref:hypothetical protein n=1 Tax=Streptomyces sp. B1866 TaxID=3075431 RepID=UPI0028917614|nr:hypothetical protein [Streptomyces sp. B1866]MDT3395535.1 hypothetical protein [Streptomyces sp. B1866]